MKKSLISSAVLAALGVTAAGSALAVPVTGLTLRDVGSNSANGIGNYSATLDGNVGAFKFATKYINTQTYGGASFFTGDVGTGTIIGEGNPNVTGSFSTGFLFGTPTFVPMTFGSGVNADITGGNMTVSTMDFGGNFGGGSNFLLAPDANYPLQVLWTQATANADDFNVAVRWGHIITTAEDPSGNFVGQNAQWVIEGCASTIGNVGAACGAATGTTSPVPVPAAAWLFGSGLLGMAGVARRRKARKS